MNKSELKIGELATRAGVSVDVVRYYERMKLLPLAPRTSGGFRLFESNSIERVQFIRQAQKLGLFLEEIRGILSIGGADECRKVCDLLSTKLKEIDEQMTSMKTFRRILTRHFKDCERELQRHGSAACCPVVAGIKRKQATLSRNE
jgi:DNA-binding transcriptional MerR regulator